MVQSPINAHLCIRYRGASYICDGILSVAQTMKILAYLQLVNCCLCNDSIFYFLCTVAVPLISLPIELLCQARSSVLHV